MVPQPDTNKMDNDNSNTAQGNEIAAAFINAVAQVILASPDLNKSMTSFSNSIYLLQVKVAALEETLASKEEALRDLISRNDTFINGKLDRLTDRVAVVEIATPSEGKSPDREQMDGEISELRDQFVKLKGRLDDVEDTVSGCDGLPYRVDDLESQVEDLDAVTTDQVEDIVSDRLSSITPLTACNIVTLGLRGLVEQVETEGVKI